jgi:acetyl esterase/lipase
MHVLLIAMLAAAPAETTPAEVLLWRDGAPGSQGKTGAEVVEVSDKDGFRRVHGIHKPSVTPYLPSRGAATGAAVIIMPGGGHKYLSIDNEGHAVARWLAEHGVAAFVLKYRLAREEGSTYKVEEHALHDAQRAVRLVRSRARDWNVDPARVGVMGFSAGGELAGYAASRYDAGDLKAKDPIERQSSRPAFQALLYPGGPHDGAAPAKDTPPAFLCAAYDDRNPSRNAVAIFERLRDGGVPAELHIFARGGHGFGMKDRPMPITGWINRFDEWLKDQGFLDKSDVPVRTATTGR